MKPHVTQARLKELLRYDEVDGVFYWCRDKGRAFAGDAAGRSHKRTKYVRIGLDGRIYSAHRLAWLYVHGALPALIDHKDGDPTNNRLSNLREATPSQNQFNSCARGFCIDRQGRFRAYVYVNRKQIHLGAFTTREAAAAARLAGQQKYHAEFGSHVSRSHR